MVEELVREELAPKMRDWRVKMKRRTGRRDEVQREGGGQTSGFKTGRGMEERLKLEEWGEEREGGRRAPSRRPRHAEIADAAW